MELQAPIDDQRLDLPSASGIERIVQCPGAWRLEQSNPGDSASEWADRGTRIHDANERGDVSDLPEDEADIVVRTREREEQLFLQWVAEFQLNDVRIYREERLYISHALEPIASVKMDFCAVGCAPNGKFHALVLDLKSGRLEVSPPQRNWQLRTAAVACLQEYDAERVRVSIVQPLRKQEPPCDYDRGTLGAAFRLLVSKLAEAQKPDAPLNVGKWCDYCRARHLCPEIQKSSEQLVALNTAAWSAVPAEKKPEIFAKARQVRKALEDLISRIEAEVDEGKIPGLMRGPGQNVRHITDPIQLYGILRQTFGEKVTPQKFAEIVSVKIGKATKDNPNKGLEDLVRESADLNEKGKPITWESTKEWVNGLGDLITTKPKKGSIIPVVEVKQVEDAK